MSDIAHALYPGAGPVSGGPNATLIDGGKVGTAPTPAPAQPTPSPAPAPDTAPRTLANIFYRDAPIQGRAAGPNGIEAGVAKAPESAPAANPQANPAAQPGSDRNAHPRAEGDNQRATTPPTNEPFNAERLTPPEGLQLDPVMLGEFGNIARDLKLDHAGGERLFQLHARAVQAANQAQMADWESQSRTEFGDSLPTMAAEIRSAIGHEPEFFAAMDASGLGSHPAVLKVLARLARRY